MGPDALPPCRPPWWPAAPTRRRARPARPDGARRCACLQRGGRPAAPQPPAADVFVQVNPSTAEPGFLVGLKASCTDNTLPATVESPAFGTVTVQPQGGLLTAAAMVPAHQGRHLPGTTRMSGRRNATTI